MKRWDVFDLLLSMARRQQLRFRLEKDSECDTFYFDDPLRCLVDGRPSIVALAIVYTQNLRIDVLLGGSVEQLKLHVDRVSLQEVPS